MRSEARFGQHRNETMADYIARLTQQQLTLEVDRSAKQLIAKEGFDPQFGARPLKRAIQDRLLDPLATKLLLGEFKPGDRIKVAAHDGELEFAKK
jgi:ATP-dependent Clp protease ATP-binding subunit ClpA